MGAQPAIANSWLATFSGVPTAPVPHVQGHGMRGLLRAPNASALKYGGASMATPDSAFGVTAAETGSCIVGGSS